MLCLQSISTYNLNFLAKTPLFRNIFKLMELASDSEKSSDTNESDLEFWQDLSRAVDVNSVAELSPVQAKLSRMQSIEDASDFDLSPTMSVNQHSTSKWSLLDRCRAAKQVEIANVKRVVVAHSKQKTEKLIKTIANKF